MFNKKSQAAMEFLMTYGWAILIVLAVIATLTSFGVLNTDMFIPERCIIGAGAAGVVNCNDFKIGADGLPVISLENNGAKGDLTVTSVEISGRDLGTFTCGGALVANVDLLSHQDAVTIYLANGKSKKDSAPTATEVGLSDNKCTYKSDAGIISGKKLQFDIYLSYTLEDSSIPHTVKGEVTASVEKS